VVNKMFDPQHNLPCQARGEKILAKFHFTSCAAPRSWLKKLAEAGTLAAAGNGGLILPASSRWGQSQNWTYRSEEFCQPAKSIGRGAARDNHNIDGKNASCKKAEFAPGFFEGKPRCKHTKPNPLLNQIKTAPKRPIP